MKISLKSFWPAVAGLIVATILFCLPGQQFPEEDWFSKIYLDKWVHLGFFASLVTLWCLPFIHKFDDATRVRNIFTWIALLFVAYGVAIEFVQRDFIPYRTFGIDDMIADALGCGAGLLFARFQLKKHKT